MLHKLLHPYPTRTLHLRSLSSTMISLKYYKKYNDAFKVEIEEWFKAEVTEKLWINNIAITETFNQKFETFQTLMLQTMKYLVVTMLSPITQ